MTSDRHQRLKRERKRKQGRQLGWAGASWHGHSPLPMRPDGAAVEHVCLQGGDDGEWAPADLPGSHCCKGTSPGRKGECCPLPHAPGCPWPQMCLPNPSPLAHMPLPPRSLPGIPQTMSPSDYFPRSPGHHWQSPQQVGRCGSQSRLPPHHEPQEGRGRPTLVTADSSSSCQVHGSAH